MTAAILLLGLCVVASSAEASCLFGDDCLFPCRCQDKEECNSNMGTCSECMDGFPRPNNQPDRFKWGGAACQTGNVAYNKRTDQSGVYGGLISSKAAIPETATTPTSSSTASSNIKTTTKASKTVLPTDPNQTTKQNKFLHVIDPY
ncbi:hypothetical protein CAPTEDRAFT_188593 [Capitella teleta]|uniref:Uncharacterized protein n=1 Tax=Capitella teleta TaxID=283909 RepID=R7U5B8_CAPTE|nr:hypothetical protein CAPTEDRAFT_188593 [Capitella teleta]|eukprot:ELU01174.1 hypothetical protein CAPTEDRAFT_188593 [Capitella teleta]